MFDMSFSEIAVIGAVALVVLGPERLPKVARTAGHLFGRLQRYVNSVKSDISREMEASEFSKLKQDVQDAARSFEQTVQEHATSLETEAKAIQTSAEKTLADSSAAPIPAPAPTPALADSPSADSTGTSSSATADAAIYTRVAPAESTAVGESPILPVASPAAPAIEQGMFDFGIEPLRNRTSSSLRPEV